VSVVKLFSIEVKRLCVALKPFHSVPTRRPWTRTQRDVTSHQLSSRLAVCNGLHVASISFESQTVNCQRTTRSQRMNAISKLQRGPRIVSSIGAARSRDMMERTTSKSVRAVDRCTFGLKSATICRSAHGALTEKSWRSTNQSINQPINQLVYLYKQTNKQTNVYWTLAA